MLVVEVSALIESTDILHIFLFQRYPLPYINTPKRLIDSNTWCSSTFLLNPISHRGGGGGDFVYPQVFHLLLQE